MSKPLKTYRPRSGETGFSIVELMVSIAIGIVLVLAMVALLIKSNRNNMELIKNNKLIDSAKAAAFLIEQDLVHAGYWGGFVPEFDDLMLGSAPTDVPDAVLDPCGITYPPSGTEAEKAQARKNLIGIPVQAHPVEVVGGKAVSPVCSGLIKDPVAGSDVLVVRYAERAPSTKADGSPNPDGNLMIQVERCGTKRPTLGYVIDSVGANLNLRQVSCNAIAEYRKVNSHIYYVRNYAKTAGDNIPTLMRSRLSLNGTVIEHQASEPLVEGIENFRVQLGIDDKSKTSTDVDFSAGPAFAANTPNRNPTNRGDGAADRYVRCAALTNCPADVLVNVAAVKFHLLVRSDAPSQGATDSKKYRLADEDLPPFNDRFSRHVFSQTVRVANVSSRRESP